MPVLSRALAVATLTAASVTAHAQIQITEWMYNGNTDSSTKVSEYVEFTNLGGSAVNFAGWSFSDSARNAGDFSLSAFGWVAPGESVVMTEGSAADFRAAWGLTATQKVLGGNARNLGRSDEINLYDASNQLVDRFTYGDAAFPGTIRTQTSSGNPNSLSALTTTQVNANWVLAFTGDSFGSHMTAAGDVGNPGFFALAAPVPEPETWAMLVAGLATIAGIARRRRARG